MQSPGRHEIWSAVRRERLQLVADLAPVEPAQFDVPSLCPGWDVHDVLAHLVDTALTSRRGFVVDMARAHFDCDRQNAAPLATRLVEAYVHGEDIRRPLQITAYYRSRPSPSRCGTRSARARRWVAPGIT